MTPEARARLLVLAGAVLWGTTGTAQALGPPTTSPATVGALRITVGAVGLVGVALAVGRASRLRSLPVVGRRCATLAAAGGMASYQLCFFAGVARAGVAVGTVVAIGSAPVATGLLALVIRAERPDWRWMAATALAVTGCILLVAPPGMGEGASGVDPLGVALALGAGLSYAVFVVASKGLLDAGVGVVDAMAITFGLGALLLVPVLVIGDLAWAVSTGGLALAGYLGVVTVTVAYLLYASGLAALSPPTAATLTLAEPLTAAVLGLLLLAERPGAVGTAGGLLVLSGLVLLTVRRRAVVPEAPPLPDRPPT